MSAVAGSGWNGHQLMLSVMGAVAEGDDVAGAEVARIDRHCRA
ncbi:hypothetical protein ACQP1G_17480 [Nocardia sp. CA-107356]